MKSVRGKAKSLSEKSAEIVKTWTDELIQRIESISDCLPPGSFWNWELLETLIQVIMEDESGDQLELFYFVERDGDLFLTNTNFKDNYELVSQQTCSPPKRKNWIPIVIAERHSGHKQAMIALNNSFESLVSALGSANRAFCCSFEDDTALPAFPSHYKSRRFLQKIEALHCGLCGPDSIATAMNYFLREPRHTAKSIYLLLIASVHAPKDPETQKKFKYATNSLKRSATSIGSLGWFSMDDFVALAKELAVVIVIWRTSPDRCGSVIIAILLPDCKYYEGMTILSIFHSGNEWNIGAPVDDAIYQTEMNTIVQKRVDGSNVSGVDGVCNVVDVDDILEGGEDADAATVPIKEETAVPLTEECSNRFVETGSDTVEDASIVDSSFSDGHSDVEVLSEGLICDSSDED